MRIAPLAFLVNPTDPQDRILIRDVCRITHHNDEAYAGALAVTLAIHAVLSGSWSRKHSFLATTVGSLPDCAVRDRMNELLPLKRPAPEIAQRFGATGHVVDTVPLALYCAQSIASEPLANVLARTVSLGGDSDTIASITGQLSGTVVGLTGVPLNLLADVSGGDELRMISKEFAEFVVKRNHQSAQLDA